MNDQLIRQRILDKFHEMSYTYGLKRVTVDSLAKECGISKKTVYKHFKSKDEIITCISDSIFAGIRKQAYEISEMSVDPLEKLTMFFDLSILLFQNIPKILLYDLQQFFPNLQEDLDLLIEDLVQIAVKSITEGIKIGLFKKLNPNFIIAFLIGAAKDVINADFMLQNNITIGEALASYKQLALSGLLQHEQGQMQ